jgi:DNA mismatch repair ATPase MutS
VRDQYRSFRRAFPGDALFMQVGRYIEFYQPDERALAASLGLNPMQPNRRGARWGFPLRQFSGHLMRLLQQGRKVTLVGETGRRLARIEARAPQWRFVPWTPS